MNFRDRRKLEGRKNAHLLVSDDSWNRQVVASPQTGPSAASSPGHGRCRTTCAGMKRPNPAKGLAAGMALALAEDATSQR